MASKIAATPKAPKAPPRPITPDPAAEDVAELARALGMSETEAKREFATYTHPPQAVSGPGCLSDLDWSSLRHNRQLPKDQTVRAHLASCIRCFPRAAPFLTQKQRGQLLDEKFPAELLCVDADTLVLAVDDPGKISEAARTHLTWCGTCREDLTESRKGVLTREFAEQVLAYALSSSERHRLGMKEKP